MRRKEFSPPDLESLQPRHSEIKYHEYTPVLDGHMHPYHVATIDLGKSDEQAENDPQRLEAALQRKDDLIAQALELTMTLFAARGGTRYHFKNENTRLPLNGETDMLNAHACVRITIFGSFAASEDSL